MIWRLTYCNKEGVEARVDIIKGDRSPVEIVEGSGNPFTMSYRLDKTDKSGHIMTSSADIEIFETETFNIDDLKTSNETELKVEYFEENILTWSGFILPDFFSREIGSPNIVRMTASDRLTALKGVTLSDLPLRVSLRSLIERCLNKTGLNLGLVAQIQINQGSTNILDSEVLSQRLADVRGRSISCYDILMSIMVGTNSTIRQRAGQWQVYNKLEHELRTPTIFFDKVERGAIRTIQPVASSVGVYQEFGGGKPYPDNYDFSDGLTGWTAEGGFVASTNDKEILGYYLTYNLEYGTEIVPRYFVNTSPYSTTSFLRTDSIPSPYTSGEVEVSATVNAVGPYVNGTKGRLRLAVVAIKEGTTLYLKDGSFSSTTPYIHEHLFEEWSPTGMVPLNVKLSGKIQNPSGYVFQLRMYGSMVGQLTRVTIANFAQLEFKSTSEVPKGNLYKTTQGSNFTKQHDIETAIFGDYITNGLNGYFYNYPIDDTSNLYLPSGELSSPTWGTVFDLTERPLLHHISRQKSRLFSVAHDILKANINVESFDPLAVFQDCRNRKYIAISARFDFLRSEVDVELEQIAYDDTILKRDFIYSYFGDGEEGIKSIGGISSGTGGGGSTHTHANKAVIDQLTQPNIDVLSYLSLHQTGVEMEPLLDEYGQPVLDVNGDPVMVEKRVPVLDDLGNPVFDENEDPVTEQIPIYAVRVSTSLFSDEEISAYGIGEEGGGGGGSNYERLDTWASYDSSKTGWVLSAFLGNDLNTRVSALENSSGSGSVTSVGISVPTGLSVSNSPITSSGVIAIGLQTGYSIPTTVKQGQWDTAFTNNHTHSNKTVLDGITSALISNWNTAFTNSHTHSNKTQLDLITQSNIDVLAKLSIVNSNLQINGNILATGTITTPKVIFNAAGWSMEQVGSELQMKHNNILKMRFTSTGAIVATNEITAFA